MGWTLEYVRDMEEDDYDELVAWSNRPKEGDDSMDMDQVIEAKKRKADGD